VALGKRLTEANTAVADGSAAPTSATIRQNHDEPASNEVDPDAGARIAGVFDQADRGQPGAVRRQRAPELPAQASPGLRGQGGGGDCQSFDAGG